MLEVGTLVSPVVRYIPENRLTESIKGKYYHLCIETGGISESQEVIVAKALVDQLYKKFHADVVWMRIENGTIDMQLMGSPFIWTLLLGFIPSLLLVLAIIFVSTGVWSVVSSIPSWAWALLAVGGILIFVGPKIGKSLTGASTQYVEQKGYRTYLKDIGV
jgi:hypothetical protein